MELYQEILAKILSQTEISISFPQLEINAKEIVELSCYQALQKIQTIIRDESLEDETCFMEIERILCIFEDIGSNGGGRHDF